MKENYEFKKDIAEGGLTHIHTEMSKDAILRLDEIGEYVAGYLKSEYFVVSDHLTSPHKEQRRSESEVREKIEEMLNKVDRYNKSRNRPKCISGIEANIISGAIDIPDVLIEKIDFVIASRHFPWGNEGPSKIAENLISAMRNPNVDVIGHIDRYVNTHIDWDSVFRTAETTNTFIEIGFDISPAQEILRMMSKYKILYTLGLDFHTFQGLKRRMPIDSEVITDFAEAKKIEKSRTPEGAELRREYLRESVGFGVLKKLIHLIKQLEANGISTDSIVNTLKLNDFLTLIKKPKRQRTL